jgi:type IV pilus assembly protein PilO
MQGGVTMNQAFQELIRQKRRALILLAALLLLNIGLYVTVSTYVAPAVIAAQVSWSDLRQRVAAVGKADVASVYRRGIDDLKKLSAKVPEKRQFPRVLGELFDSAASSGVNTGSVTYKPEAVKGQDLLSYTVTMSVSGRYAAIKSFLADLQKQGEMIVVDDIKLSNSDLYEENVSMELHLIVYLQGRLGA